MLPKLTKREQDVFDYLQNDGSFTDFPHGTKRSLWVMARHYYRQNKYGYWSYLPVLVSRSVVDSLVEKGYVIEVHKGFYKSFEFVKQNNYFEGE